MSLRTPETEARYQHTLDNNTGSALKDVEPLRTYPFWKLIPNQFPYDQFFKVHHLLIPKRVVGDRTQLNQDETAELYYLMKMFSSKYDCMMENFPSRRTVPSHFHIHLMTYK